MSKMNKSMPPKEEELEIPADEEYISGPLQSHTSRPREANSLMRVDLHLQEQFKESSHNTANFYKLDELAEDRIEPEAEPPRPFPTTYRPLGLGTRIQEPGGAASQFDHPTHSQGFGLASGTILRESGFGGFASGSVLK